MAVGGALGVVDQIVLPEHDLIESAVVMADFKARTWPTVEFALLLVRAGDEYAERLLRQVAEQVADANLDEAT